MCTNCMYGIQQAKLNNLQVIIRGKINKNKGNKTEV